MIIVLELIWSLAVLGLAGNSPCGSTGVFILFILLASGCAYAAGNLKGEQRVRERLLPRRNKGSRG